MDTNQTTFQRFTCNAFDTGLFDDLSNNKYLTTERLKFILFFLFFLTADTGFAQSVFMKEDFQSLDNWNPLNFPKIEAHSKYSVEEIEGEKVLKAESNASASGLIFKQTFSIQKYPKLQWIWRVENVYKTANETTKAGDDYPIRLYVIFKYHHESADFWKKAKYDLAKQFYGEYPPHSSLNYVWASNAPAQAVITSPYADEVKVIVMNSGNSGLGKWQTHQVDMVQDYRRVFQEEPPDEASIAIMSDSDNTHEKAVAYIRNIIISE